MGVTGLDIESLILIVYSRICSSGFHHFEYRSSPS